MPTTAVIFPPSVRSHFTRHAKKHFPNETLAILLGKPGKIPEITALYYPTLLSSDKNSVSFDGEEYEFAAKEAAKDGWVVLGDLHSHPYEQQIIDAAPSETDWVRSEYFPKKATVHAICAVTQMEPGKLRARYRFWPVNDPIVILAA